MRPVVGIVCDVSKLGKHNFHVAGEKYIAAVRSGSGATPVLIPSLPDPISPDEILGLVDGLLITGALSNVHPSRYGGPDPRPGTLEDPQRDDTTLGLIPAALERGVPLFCICRGFQELNVALGGTLHPHIHELPGRMDHRENNDDPLDVQYGPAHQVALAEGGFMAGLLKKSRVSVNSLHGQGILDIAPGLAIDAQADDGTIEAVRVKDAKGFAFGVQWHPEWKVTEAGRGDDLALFQAFGAACETYRQEKHS